MRRNKITFLCISTAWFALACMAVNLPRPEPTFTIAPTATQTKTPLPTQTALPTPIPTYLQATPLPEWVTDFAEPILVAVADRKPDFQDDFSRYRGWLNLRSGVIGPVYADRFDDKLPLNLPEKRGYSILYNPRVNRTNFVLTLDLRFFRNQPNDIVRIQFDRSPDQSVALDLSNNRNWRFQWGAQDNPQIASGIYEHFPPDHLPVTIIMLDAQCAVYLNHDPLLHVEDCRVIPILRSKDWVMSFRLFRDNARAVLVNIDNFKLWDLDKISDLP